MALLKRMAELFRSNRMFVMPSYGEGFRTCVCRSPILWSSCYRFSDNAEWPLEKNFASPVGVPFDAKLGNEMVLSETILQLLDSSTYDRQWRNAIMKKCRAFFSQARFCQEMLDLYSTVKTEAGKKQLKHLDESSKQTLNEPNTSAANIEIWKKELIRTRWQLWGIKYPKVYLY